MTEVAADGIPVAPTCRVLKIARQPYYRWLAAPIMRSELADAYLAHALFDTHRDDPEYGYQLLAYEARDADHDRCDRTIWRVCAGTAGGRRSARNAGRTARSQDRPRTTTSSNGTSPRRPRTGSGGPISPSTGPARASPTSAPSRTGGTPACGGLLRVDR